MRTPSGLASLSFDVIAAGDRPARDLLFLHAGVCDKRSWRSMAAGLSDRYRCITFDARGFGDTTYVTEPGWSAVDDAVRVLDAAGSDRAVLVGASLGGRTAIDLALAYPDRVVGLILIAPAVRGAPYPDPTEQEAALEEAAEQAAEDDRVEDANRFEARLWLDGPTSPEGRVSGEARELFLSMNDRALRSPDPGTPAACSDAWPRLSELAVPTLILSGDLDTSDMRTIARQLASAVPNGSFAELAGVAHLPQLEAPAAVLSAIGDFLEKLTRSG